MNFTFTESKCRKKIFLGGVEGRDGGRWMDRRTGPNQFAPSTSSKLGGITMHSYTSDKLNLLPLII